MLIGIIEPLNFSNDAISILEKIGKVDFYKGNNINNFVEDKDVLFIRLEYYFDSAILKSASKLKYICSPTTGLNHLDLKFLAQKKVKIISLKGENDFLKNIRATSEHTLGLIISLIRNYKSINFSSRKNFKRDNFIGYEIYNTTIGIIGFGRIGLLLSKYIDALGGKLVVYDPYVAISNQYKRVSEINDLINSSEIICLCASHEVDNHFLINRDQIDLMKNKYFINTSRGELVNESYLYKKIKKNFFKGIALDVINNENTKNNLINFLNIDKSINFILTPHIGGATFYSMQETEIFIAKNLLKHINER
jgi:D-3-phosphoglycerate dehydrogenase